MRTIVKRAHGQPVHCASGQQRSSACPLGLGLRPSARVRPPAAVTRSMLPAPGGHLSGQPCSMQPATSRSVRPIQRVQRAGGSSRRCCWSSAPSLSKAMCLAAHASAAGSSLDARGFHASAATSGSLSRSVSTSAVSSLAPSTAVLDVPSQSSEPPEALSIFPRSSTTDSLDIDNLQDQVQSFMQKYERAQSGREAGTSNAEWQDHLTADDQQRLEVSRQRHKLEQQGLSSTAQLPAEHPESPAAAVVAQMVRRREREAKRLARKAAAAQKVQDVKAMQEAALLKPARVAKAAKAAAKAAAKPKASVLKKATALRPASKRALLASTHSQQRGRTAASRTAELRSSSHAAWGKSTQTANMDVGAQVSRAAVVPQKRGRGRPSRQDQPFQIMFRSQNHLAHKLLTMEEEQLHAKIILQCRGFEEKHADMVTQAGGSPSWEDWAAECEQDDLVAFRDLITRGRQSRAIFEQCNLRLVAKIAYKYIDRGLELEDLMSYGITGLNRAIDRFEPQRGFKFSTYAHWWIRQVISRAVCDKGRTIRIPCHLHDLRSKAYKRLQMMTTELMREPTTAELADSLKVPEKKLEQLTRVFKASASLEAPTKSEGNEGNLVDALSVENRPDETAAQAAVRDALDASLSTLDQRERIVMRMRYGLDDGMPRTLEDIGKYFKVTRERIRQIEGKAFRKMSQPGRISVADTEWTASPSQW